MRSNTFLKLAKSVAFNGRGVLSLEETIQALRPVYQRIRTEQGRQLLSDLRQALMEAERRALAQRISQLKDPHFDPRVEGVWVTPQAFRKSVGTDAFEAIAEYKASELARLEHEFGGDL